MCLQIRTIYYIDVITDHIAKASYDGIATVVPLRRNVQHIRALEADLYRK